MSLPRYDAETAKLLSLHPDDMSLRALGNDIRLLLKLREDGKIALAVRLAIAHKIISTGQTEERSFVAWCKRNVVLNGKPIGPHSIWRLVRIGEKRNPAKAYEELKKEERELQRNKMARLMEEARLGRNIVAIESGRIYQSPKPAVNASYDANEINALVSAWEKASEYSRRQFLHMIGASQARRA